MKRKLCMLPVLVVTMAQVLTASPGKKKSKSQEPAAPTTAKLTAYLPSMAPLPESQPSQDKGGLKISIAPVQYSVREDSVVSLQRATPSWKESFLLQHSQYDVFVEKTTNPILRVAPERLRFQVALSNQMPRVFHGAGIVVQFNVAGKLVAVDPAGYADLVQMILPPRSEQHLEIHGPQLTTVPSPSTVGLFFYDVVTNTDNAGNVTEKQNFEWYFSFASQLIEKEVQVPPPERLFMPPGRLIEINGQLQENPHAR